MNLELISDKGREAIRELKRLAGIDSDHDYYREAKAIRAALSKLGLGA
jgi:hypothetical protein